MASNSLTWSCIPSSLISSGEGDRVGKINNQYFRGPKLSVGLMLVTQQHHHHHQKFYSGLFLKPIQASTATASASELVISATESVETGSFL